jgi:Na+-translocating ferredoxin:NAD+ oxidoreductase subunit C
MFEFDQKNTALPCVRCGDCIPACPAKLQPQALLLAVQANDNVLMTERLLDLCTECGACDAACPSRIPLSTLFKTAKLTIVRRDARDTARLRFENRTLRLQRLAVEKEKRHDERKQNAASSDGVAQALARAKAKREQTKGSNT